MQNLKASIYIISAFMFAVPLIISCFVPENIAQVVAFWCVGAGVTAMGYSADKSNPLLPIAVLTVFVMALLFTISAMSETTALIL